MGLTTYVVEPGAGFTKGSNSPSRIAGNTVLTNFASCKHCPGLRKCRQARATRSKR